MASIPYQADPSLSKIVHLGGLLFKKTGIILHSVWKY